MKDCKLKNPDVNGRSVMCETAIYKGEEKRLYKFFIYEHTVIEEYDVDGIAIYTVLMLLCRTDDAVTGYGLAAYTTHYTDYYLGLPDALLVLPLGSLPLYAPPEHVTELLVDLAQAVQKQYVLYTDTKDGE